MTDDRPLIVTLWMEEAAAERLDAMRRRHFPAERNVLRAHLTLFHALPGGRLGEVLEEVERVCGETGPLGLRAAGLMSLGKGVAVRVEEEGDGAGLKGVRARLAEAFAGGLTRQDAGGFRPHVTIQNKVTPERARATLSVLRGKWEGFVFRGEGLEVWRYDGGPWEAAARYRFTGGGGEGRDGE